jgi:hypothetical protein
VIQKELQEISLGDHLHFAKRMIQESESQGEVLSKNPVESRPAMGRFLWFWVPVRSVTLSSDPKLFLFKQVYFSICAYKSSLLACWGAC